MAELPDDNEVDRQLLDVEVPPGVSELAEVYFHAKAVILFYETHERKMAVSALTDLRDALDHLMLADVASTEGNPERVRSNLTSAEEHLRRAAMEPMEYAVESRVHGLMGRYRLLNVQRLLFIPGPPQRDDVAEVFGEVYHHLMEARQRKNSPDWQQGLKHLLDAYECVTSLDRLLPAEELFRGRLFQVGCTVVGAALSVAFYFAWKMLFGE